MEPKWSHLRVLGPPLGVLGSPLGVLGPPLCVLGRSLASYGSPLEVLRVAGRSLGDVFGMPFGTLWGPFGVSGSKAHPKWSKMDQNIEKHL